MFTKKVSREGVVLAMTGSWQQKSRSVKIMITDAGQDGDISKSDLDNSDYSMVE